MDGFESESFQVNGASVYFSMLYRDKLCRGIGTSPAGRFTMYVVKV